MINTKYLSQFDVVSFDIFDTLITRNYIDAKDLFYDMQNQLRDDKYNDFAQIRIKAELECRRQDGFQKEVTLDEIYKFMLNESYIDKLTSSDINMLTKMELDLEKSNLYANQEMNVLVEELQKNNKKVILISDIYLPKDFIINLLNDLGFHFKNENIYLSSEYKVMKSNKKLFELVLEDLNIQPKKMCHIGDNKISDVDNPKSLSINALHYSNCIANRYEKQENHQSIIHSMLRGLSRRNRLANPYKDTLHKSTIWETTSNVSAPLMVGYTLWCLQKAKELKLDRVYFCSRDGQILYKIAQELMSKLDFDIKISYLYVSRQSLLFPSVKNIDKESLEWIMAPTALLTPSIILKRVNVLPEEIYHILAQYGFHDKLDTHIPHAQRGKFRSLLKEIESLIVSRANKYKKNTKSYLKQEGLYDSKFAIVDIGWSGTLQRSISQFLSEDGYGETVHGLYFGIKRRKKHKESDQLHGWFTDYEAPRELDKKTYIIPMTELFTAALHGGVHSHVNSGDRYEAKLLKPINDTGIAWGVEVQHESMINFASNLASSPNFLDTFLKDQKIDYLEENYERFILNPTYDEAKAYGEYEDAEDQNESYYRKLAQPYTLLERFKIRKDRNFKHHHNEWKEGALQLTPFKFKNLM